MKKTISIIVSIMMIVLCLTACTGKQMTQADTYSTDNARISKYIGDSIVFDSVEFEQVNVGGNYGPTDPRYVCVLHFTEEHAEDLRDKYYWRECEYPGFSFAVITVENAETCSWYTSEAFEKELMKLGHLNGNAVFNGEDVVFDFTSY